MWFNRALGLAFFLTPLFLRKWIAKLIANLSYYVFRVRRYTLLKNLWLAFPELSPPAREKIAVRSLENHVLNIFEFFSLAWVPHRGALPQYSLRGLDHYHLAHKQNKGVLWLTLHMGNGDLACSILSLNQFKVHLISKHFKQKWINKIWFGFREKMGTQFIDPHHPRNAFQILAALKAQENVAFVLDQYMGKPFGIETHFFGRKVGTAYGLALFALKAKCPVLPVFTYRDRAGATCIQFEAPLFAKNFDPETNRDLQILLSTEEYNKWLESVVRRYPEQWMWLHRRWKRFK